MNAQELSQRLADDALRIAEYLLPGGKKASGEWKAGSVSGDAGGSLSVRLTGTKKGIWKDFNTGESGDLLDLWAAVRILSIGQAMAEAKAFLGIRDSMPKKDLPTYKRPAKPAAHKPKRPVRDWLMSRGLTEETIAAFQIAEQERNGKAYAVFPYLREGEFINAKYRCVSDKKDMRQEGGAEPCLFGWQLIDPKTRTVAIFEGEIDAMTGHQMGIPSLSVNAGAGNHQWLDNDWERLQRFSEIYLCYDNDEAGQKGAREVANRLGLERCKVVLFDKAKDANDYMLGGAEAADFDHCFRAARPFDPEELRPLSDFWGQVKASFWPAGDKIVDPCLTFNGTDHTWFQFRGGELTVWTGYNGHGKSLLLNQVLIGLQCQGERVCVFSGEMTPVNQGRRMTKQLTGQDRPTQAYFDHCGQWLQDKAWLFNLTGTATIDRLLEVFRYGFKRYGIRHFVIDSLMMTDVPEDGAGAMSAQKEAMRKLASFCREFGVHLHLVAHPRKGENEKKNPGKMDVAGSSKLTDAADNVFSVWSAQKEDGESPDTPDAKLELHKQRNGETQARSLYLFFNRQAMQFTTNPQRRPYTYVQYAGVPEMA
ncbi:toprim domain-containing protein [Achromobacter xylosoxidans]